MVRIVSAALAGIALCSLAATSAAADGGRVQVYHAHPYHALYPAEIAPYIGSVRRPHVLGRHGPRIAMSPARFHAYPYVSTFDSCWRHMRRGKHWHRVWVCG
jgi:hypothetical protein